MVMTGGWCKWHCFTYMGVSINRATPSPHPFRTMGFSLKSTIQLLGTPMTNYGNPHMTGVFFTQKSTSGPSGIDGRLMSPNCPSKAPPLP